MKYRLAVLLAFLAVNSFAAKPAGRAPQNASKSSVSTRSPSNWPQMGDLIPQHIRENIFNKADLTQEIRAFDEMDRDFFIMMVWKKSVSEVARKYPNISTDKIREAKRLAVEAMK